MQSGALATVRTKEPSTIMLKPDFQVKHPVQLQLAGAEVLEITLRVGVIRALDHVQFQLDLVDASTGELISCASRHHVGLDDAMSELSDWVRVLEVEVWAETAPF